jgi:HNH endonuclease
VGEAMHLTYSTATATPAGYRGQPADTLDHVITKMDGGRDDPNNLMACCHSSNSEGGRAAERF